MSSSSQLHNHSGDVQLSTYKNLLQGAKSSDDFRYIIDQFVETSSNVSLVVARPILSDLVTKIARQEELLLHALEVLTLHSSKFEEQVMQIREALASHYEGQQDFREAARILHDIPLETGQRYISEDYKLRTYIRIVRCLLEEDDIISADSYLHRAALLIQENSDPEIVLPFRLSQARIFDAKRKFIEASQKYHEISFAVQIPEAERAACLEAAMTCGILGPAGPARSRLLSTLYKDDRAQSLSNYRILEKMFLDRLIEPQEVAEFSQGLKTHQLALLSDGTTVVSRAVIEHNVLSASKLYENIGLGELGDLLGLDARAAERFARRMIDSNRLLGVIDQVAGIVEFSNTKTIGAEGVESARWDKAIQNLLSQVEECATNIEKTFPEWYEQRQQLMT